jgi:hypothetical protein
MPATAAQVFQTAHRITRNMRAFLWTSTPYREVFAMALKQAHAEVRAAAKAAASLAAWAARIATEDLPRYIARTAEAARDFAGCRDADTRARARREWDALKVEVARRGIA